MKFEAFFQQAISQWNQYFIKIYGYQKQGLLNTSGGNILYPTMVLGTNCGNKYFVVELIGADESFRNLRHKTHKEASIYRYMSQFDDFKSLQPAFIISGSNFTFKNLCISHQIDLNSLISRFPILEIYKTRIQDSASQGSVIDFSKDFKFTVLENCLLVNNFKSLVRCKNILCAFIVGRSISQSEFRNLFDNYVDGNVVKGIHNVTFRDRNKIIAGQLQSMYFFPGLRETTIGEFLSQHPDIVKKAFKTSHFHYEPYLEWIQHDGTVDDHAINPDLMIKRSDGFYDIYDLKTALLNKNSITKDQRKRRRFIDYVEEGVAQLVNYEEYFKYPENSKFAKQKYDIDVKNPRLTLVVGNYDNCNDQEIKQACRRYPPHINIINYDTLCHLFLGTS